MRQITDFNKSDGYNCYYSWDEFLGAAEFGDWIFPKYLLFKWEYVPLEKIKHFYNRYTSIEYCMYFYWYGPNGIMVTKVEVETSKYPEMLEYLKIWYDKLRILWEPVQ